MSENRTRGRKAGKTVPVNESKSDKFKRLANKRLNKVLNAMRQLKNLSSASYTSTPAQVEYITGKIDVAVSDVKTAFAGKKDTETEKITIPDN